MALWRMSSPLPWARGAGRFFEAPYEILGQSAGVVNEAPDLIGKGLEIVDPALVFQGRINLYKVTVISCQAFVLLISTFVPLPGALGAAEGSYVLFFKNIFGGYVHLSTVIWRFLTFYMAIIGGMIFALLVNKKGSFAPDESLSIPQKTEESNELQ